MSEHAQFLAFGLVCLVSGMAIASLYFIYRPKRNRRLPGICRKERAID